MKIVLRANRILWVNTDHILSMEQIPVEKGHPSTKDRLLAGSLQGLYGPLRVRCRVGIPQTYVFRRHRRRRIDRQHSRLYLAQILLLEPSNSISDDHPK